MNLRNEILKEHSKRQTLKIAKFIGNDKTKFKTLMHLFFNDEYRVVQRAAWVVNICTEAHPGLIKPYLNKMLDYLLQNPVHDAVKRNTVRIFQFITIPKRLIGKTASICFELLQSKNESVAVKVFAMSVLGRIVQNELEFKNELRLIIEEQLPYSTPGFLSRAKKVLNKL